MTREELESLASAKDANEWANACHAIKAAHRGEYPADWYAEVFHSGLAKKTAATWVQSNDMELTVEVIPEEDMKNGKW